MIQSESFWYQRDKHITPIIKRSNTCLMWVHVERDRKDGKEKERERERERKS